MEDEIWFSVIVQCFWTLVLHVLDIFLNFTDTLLWNEMRISRLAWPVQHDILWSKTMKRMSDANKEKRMKELMGEVRSEVEKITPNYWEELNEDNLI